MEKIKYKDFKLGDLVYFKNNGKEKHRRQDMVGTCIYKNELIANFKEIIYRGYDEPVRIKNIGDFGVSNEVEKFYDIFSITKKEIYVIFGKELILQAL